MEIYIGKKYKIGKTTKTTQPIFKTSPGLLLLFLMVWFGYCSNYSNGFFQKYFHASLKKEAKITTFFGTDIGTIYQKGA
ncbi:hypothetical protein [Cyclobacterium sp.]|uniref:hypothetical protein n=1 Tax=Cyclobacterium sp. TaxID=1966343 RepID=UPI0019BAF6F2|nr:hypothetical protein [Cyclobacterium sp.]MBD3630980.1 hypothetical protein [Cyclobacterium sp.]